MNNTYINIQDYRRAGELLRDRLHLLSGRDKILMSMYLDGQRISELAALLGVSTSALRRKLKKLAAALSGQKCTDYLLALRNRDKFSSLELAIARDRLIRGLSIKRIARRRKTTYYRSYRMVCKIERSIKLCRSTQSQERFVSRRVS
jgi:hypothetical protein